MEINRKLKGIYFRWAINYQGPPPRSFAGNFQEHLENEYYDFDEGWLKRILEECNISSEDEFNTQLQLIENDFSVYSEQQYQKKQKKKLKKENKIKSKDPSFLPF